MQAPLPLYNAKTIRYREKHTGSQNTPTPHAPCFIPKAKPSEDKAAHGQNDSIDTCESDRSAERDSLPGKFHLKVELCKNFISKGYCPYEGRCRFAHGIEELRARDTKQSSDLYRTRKCKVFIERGECRFGERCNFRHQSRDLSQVGCGSLNLLPNMKADFPEVWIDRGYSSRLLHLIQHDN